MVFCIFCTTLYLLFLVHIPFLTPSTAFHLSLPLLFSPFHSALKNNQQYSFLISHPVPSLLLQMFVQNCTILKRLYWYRKTGCECHVMIANELIKISWGFSKKKRRRRRMKTLTLWEEDVYRKTEERMAYGTRPWLFYQRTSAIFTTTCWRAVNGQLMNNFSMYLY